MSEAIEKMREHFNDKPVPKEAKCLAEERDKVNALIDAVEAENTQLRDRNEKLVTLVCHLMYVKPRDVIGIMHKGEVLHFDKLLEEVGLRWEDA